MFTDLKVKELEAAAREIRRNVISMLVAAGSGHPGGALGMADVMATLYLGGQVKTFPNDPWNEERDRILVSNGHICPGWYATLAQAGYFPKEELLTLRKLGSRLQGHPHYRELPGVENSGGPLGQGLSQGIGQALAANMDDKKYRVYVLMSDGELQEGSNWEAIMFAGKNNLHNLTAIVDRNNIQIDGFTEDIMTLEPLADKFRAFNWSVIEIDGHNAREVGDAIAKAHSIFENPTVIIAHTTPGKGVSFMEGKYEWHGKAPNGQEAEMALIELAD
jgi:transketolase